MATGQQVKNTDVIGVEGSTGYSTGSHCHYCVRPKFQAGCYLDVCAISGIPNKEGGVYDDGYRPAAKPVKKTIEVELKQGGVTYSGTLTEK